MINYNEMYTVTQVLTGLIEKSTILRNSITSAFLDIQKLNITIDGFSTIYLKKHNPIGTGTFNIDNAVFSNTVSAAQFYDSTYKKAIIPGLYLSSIQPTGIGTFYINNIYATDSISAKYFVSTRLCENRSGNILDCCRNFNFNTAEIYNLNITNNSVIKKVDLNFDGNIPIGQSISIKFNFSNLTYFKPIYFNGIEIVSLETKTQSFICNFMSYDGVTIDCLPIVKIIASK